MATEQQILEALAQVQDPDLHRDIVSLGFVKNIKISNGAVAFDINLTTPACPVKDQLQEQARQVVLKIPGVKSVEAKMTAEVRRSIEQDKSGLEGVKNIIAIASGKGGVGKSTVSVNLAVAMAATGAKTGLLDADIYGPTIPLMMGPSGKIQTGEGDKIIPAAAHGVKYMSMGFMAPGDKPLIWRGPMAHHALQQSLYQTVWEDLDYLIVDLPPGTGDVHLTLVQSVRVTGGVIVSTPQDVGTTISLKTFRMFQATNVRALGVIENMSYYICPHCGEREEIFGHGGAEEAAKRVNIPFLGQLPLDKAIREQADKGFPIVAALPDHPVSLAYKEIAKKMAAQASIASYQKPALSIINE